LKQTHKGKDAGSDTWKGGWDEKKKRPFELWASSRTEIKGGPRRRRISDRKDSFDEALQGRRSGIQERKRSADDEKKKVLY